MIMNFLGIDLGWKTGASGLCCLTWQNNQLQLLDLDRRESIADIISWVDTFAPAINFQLWRGVPFLLLAVILVVNLVVTLL